MILIIILRVVSFMCFPPALLCLSPPVRCWRCGVARWPSSSGQYQYWRVLWDHPSCTAAAGYLSETGWEKDHNYPELNHTAVFLDVDCLSEWELCVSSAPWHHSPPLHTPVQWPYRLQGRILPHLGYCSGQQDKFAQRLQGKIRRGFRELNTKNKYYQSCVPTLGFIEWCLTKTSLYKLNNGTSESLRLMWNPVPEGNKGLFL